MDQPVTGLGDCCWRKRAMMQFSGGAALLDPRTDLVVSPRSPITQQVVAHLRPHALWNSDHDSPCPSIDGEPALCASRYTARVRVDRNSDHSTVRFASSWLSHRQLFVLG